MSGAKPFDHGIKALMRPGNQLTGLMDRDGVTTVIEVLISSKKLLAEGERLDEVGELFRVGRSAAQSLSRRCVRT